MDFFDIGGLTDFWKCLRLKKFKKANPGPHKDSLRLGNFQKYMGIMLSYWFVSQGNRLFCYRNPYKDRLIDSSV